MSRSFQSGAERTQHQAAHAVHVAETNLGLGRMHIDVDLARRQRHKQRKQRRAATRDQIGIGGPHGAYQQAVSDRSAVDEQVLLRAVRAIERGQAGKACDANALALGLHGQRIAQEIRAHDAA
jgi:hypothetical protein